MSLTDRFEEYAAVFEQVYASNDWSLLEPFFTEDAVYEMFGDPPFGGLHEGRDAVLAYLEQSVDGFDRRFDIRELTTVEGPTERDGSVWVRWRIVYRAGSAPALVLEGEETATFEGERIRRLEDRFAPEASKEALAWLEKHGAELAPPPGDA